MAMAGGIYRGMECSMVCWVVHQEADWERGIPGHFHGYGVLAFVLGFIRFFLMFSLVMMSHA